MKTDKRPEARRPPDGANRQETKEKRRRKRARESRETQQQTGRQSETKQRERGGKRQKDNTECLIKGYTDRDKMEREAAET